MNTIEYENPSLPVMEVEELTEAPPNFWIMQLDQAVNREGKETSFDERVRIGEKIGVWDKNLS
jgi:hypothetical protein